MFRRIRWIIGTCGLVAAAIGFFTSPYYEVAKVALDYDEPYAIARYRLANLPKANFEREIEQAIDDAEFDDAQQIVAIPTRRSSDLLVVGDIRDIAIQGPKAIRGEDYDAFVLGLSLVGVATVLPSGPIDVGASVLKTAKRSGKMSARLSGMLTHTLKRLIDIGALKTAIAGGPKRLIKLNRVTGAPRVIKVSDLKIDKQIHRKF